MALRPAAIFTGLYMHCCHFPLLHACCFSDGLLQSDGRRRRKNGNGHKRQAGDLLPVSTWKRDNQEVLLFYISCESWCHFSFPSPSSVCCLFVTLGCSEISKGEVKRSKHRLDDLCVLGMANRWWWFGGVALLLALIWALYCALLQDYYINWADLITLGMREKRMEYVISLQIRTS